MFFSSSLFIAALVGIVQAQTPSGFTPPVETKLQVIFNTTTVNNPGLELPKAATASQPQIAISSAIINSSDTFIFMMLDLDVPPANGSTTRRVLLHAMNTGFKPTQQKLSGGATLLTSSEKGPAPYLPPSPPATDTVAHRYVQLLFREPSVLKVQASDFANTQARINFDVAEFMTANNVGSPVAGNFFRVDGRANAAASGTATGTSGTPRSTVQPFEGTAFRADPQMLMGGLLGSLVLFAV
ncbi:hypothetical protein ACN47E_005961 [Coniothyrium glycines]